MADRKRGQPTKLDRVIERRPSKDGKTVQTITVADRIVELLKVGAYVETAAAAAGIDRSTLHAWLRTGAAASAALATGATRGNLSRYERLAADFSVAVATAVAEHDAGAAARIETHARGGFQRTTVTTKKDGTGAVLEITKRVETLPPDAATERWRWEQKHGRAAGRVEVSGPDGGPVEVSLDDQRAEVLAEIREVAERLAESRSEIEDAEIVEDGIDD